MSKRNTPEDKSSRASEVATMTDHLNRRHMLRIAGGAAVLGLAGCGPQGIGGLGGGPGLGASPSAPSGQVLGQGTARVALLLPVSATGNAGGSAAVSFKNAADLAISALGGNDIALIVKDTGGTAEGARAAAAQAIGEGAQMILGPIFGAEVSAVGQITRSANVPVIGFSSDASVAGRGVYLLSFLPSSDVRRIVFYSAAQGKKNLAALLPQTSYGQVVEAHFRQAAAAAGARVVTVERYEPDTSKMQEPVTRLAGSKAQFDALFVPEAGAAMVTLSSILAAQGITPRNKLFLGSGQWNDAQVRGAPSLAGGVYPAPEGRGYADFASRYQARYGSAPLRIASLCYDAVTLAAALARAGQGRINPALLTSAGGFSGVDGIFRFLSNGTSQRGLAVYELAGGNTKIVSPAPTSFQGGQF